MTQSSNAQEYSLFLDESGKFTESIRNGPTLSKHESSPSQLVGFLAPSVSNVEDEAREIMGEVLKKSKFIPEKKLHGSELSDTALNNLVSDLIPYFIDKNWQPVRLVNDEQVTYGNNREINQTNIVAELVLRVFQEKARFAADPVTIHLMIDQVSIAPKTKTGYIPSIKKDGFLRPINEYLRFLTVRHNKTIDQAKWNLVGPRFGSAKTLPALQICDLLSSITYRNYQRCKPDLKLPLQKLFGPYDQSMVTSDVLDRVDELENKWSSYGMAIVLLGEVLFESREAAESEPVLNRLDHILDRLVQIGGAARDPQLRFVVSWLDQIIGQQRLIGFGFEVTAWMQRKVVQPLRTRLDTIEQGSTIDWFDFAVNRWAITAANHSGKLIDAEKILDDMRRVQTSLAGRWEHTPLLMDGFIAQAVHQTDCFEFDDAIKQMSWIADSLGQQSKRLQDIIPDVRTARVHFDVRAKALGTLTHSLILKGLREVTEQDKAREISKEAVEEFVSPDDKARQYQLRCHLETIVGNFDDARVFLMKGMDPCTELSSVTHDQIASAMIEQEKRNIPGFRFLMAHWLRIGVFAHLKGCVGEANSFAKSLTESKVQDSASLKGSQFPMHIILRYIATIQAATGKANASIKTLQHLRRITGDGDENIIFRAIEIAAVAEVAAMCWGSDEAKALLGCDGSKYNEEPLGSLKHLLAPIPKGTATFFPSLSRKFDEWRINIEPLITNEMRPDMARDVLLDIGRDVCY